MRLSHTPTATERLNALLSLPEAESSRDALLAALDDPSLQVVRAALTRLARIGGAGAAEALSARLLSCDPSLVKDHAAALAELDPDRAAAIAEAGLREPAYPRRLAAVQTLEVLGREEHAPLLRTALADPVSGIRAAALRALRAVRTTPATVSASALLLQDHATFVRREAVQSLARQGERGIAALNAVTVDPDPEVRLALARHCGRLSREHGEVLLRDVDSHVREVAARNAAAPSIPRLADMLARDQMPSVRLAVVKRLAELSQPLAVAVMVRGLRDRSSVVRAAILQSLRLRLTARELGERLSKGLRSHDPELRSAVVFALANLGEAASVEPGVIEGLAADPDPGVRAALAYAAPTLLPDPATVLTALRVDPDAGVRAIADVSAARSRTA